MGQQKSRFAKVRQKIAKVRSIKSVKSLLSQEDISVNCEITIDDCTATPLWFAVRADDYHLTEILLSVGSSVNKACGSLRTTPLHMAVYIHSVAISKLLIEHGATIDVLDNWNYTPLMYAAIHQNAFFVQELISLFINCGCDVNYGATLKSDRTVEQANNQDLLSLPSNYSHIPPVTVFKEPMGTVSGTALHLAIQNPYLPNTCIEQLLTGGADVNKLNLQGQIPLMLAMSDVYYDYHSNIKGHVELLLSHMNSKELNTKDYRGWACFHYAAQRGSIACMSSLLKSGADCNICDDNEISPLWLLLIHGWKEAANFLIMNGCNVDKPVHSTDILRVNQDVELCRYGQTFPVEYAICNKYYRTAKLMVLFGCKIDSSTYLGRVEETSNTQLVDFVEFLKEHASHQEILPSLKDMCRHAIRSIINQGLLVKCQILGLPASLIEFLCYGNSM